MNKGDRSSVWKSAVLAAAILGTLGAARTRRRMV